MTDLRKQLVLELGGDPDNSHLVSDEHIIESVRRAIEAESTMGALESRLAEAGECPGPGKCSDPGCPAHYAHEDQEGR